MSFSHFSFVRLAILLPRSFAVRSIGIQTRLDRFAESFVSSVYDRINRLMERCVEVMRGWDWPILSFFRSSTASL